MSKIENLTELEKDCLRACYASEYNGEFGTEFKPCIWSFSVADNASITKPEQVSGVIASLVKKGIVVCDGHGNERCVSVVSDEAHEYANKQGWNG